MTHYTHPTYIKYYQRSINDWILTETSGNTFLELDFGLKTSASWIIWDIGFRLPGFFISSSRVLYFGFLDYLGYWISASWIIWDIGVWGGFTLNKHNFILVQINK
ncbi:unnamed protein product [Rhizophagus irregularis]|nr:unnamed protein product [Rhizophagus irregularis]